MRPQPERRGRWSGPQAAPAVDNSQPGTQLGTPPAPTPTSTQLQPVVADWSCHPLDDFTTLSLAVSLGARPKETTRNIHLCFHNPDQPPPTTASASASASPSDFEFDSDSDFDSDPDPEPGPDSDPGHSTFHPDLNIHIAGSETWTTPDQYPGLPRRPWGRNCLPHVIPLYHDDGNDDDIDVKDLVERDKHNQSPSTDQNTATSARSPCPPCLRPIVQSLAFIITAALVLLLVAAVIVVSNGLSVVLASYLSADVFPARRATHVPLGSTLQHLASVFNPQSIMCLPLSFSESLRPPDDVHHLGCSLSPIRGAHSHLSAPVSILTDFAIPCMREYNEPACTELRHGLEALTNVVHEVLIRAGPLGYLFMQLLWRLEVAAKRSKSQERMMELILEILAPEFDTKDGKPLGETKLYHALFFSREIAALVARLADVQPAVDAVLSTLETDILPSPNLSANHTFLLEMTDAIRSVGERTTFMTCQFDHALSALEDVTMALVIASSDRLTRADTVPGRVARFSKTSSFDDWTASVYQIGPSLLQRLHAEASATLLCGGDKDDNTTRSTSTIQGGDLAHRPVLPRSRVTRALDWLTEVTGTLPLVLPSPSDFIESITQTLNWFGPQYITWVELSVDKVTADAAVTHEELLQFRAEKLNYFAQLNAWQPPSFWTRLKSMSVFAAPLDPVLPHFIFRSSAEEFAAVYGRAWHSTPEEWRRKVQESDILLPVLEPILYERMVNMSKK